MLIFGTGGIPHSSKQHNIFSGIEQIKEIGLGAIELEFVYQTWLNKEDAKKVKDLAKKLGVTLTSHGSYYINLNATESQKMHASISRIIKSAEVCELAGVRSLTFHPGFYLSKTPEQAYFQVHSALKLLEQELKKRNIKNLRITLETTGKQSQFGTVQEIVQLSKEFDFIWPCIDFSHLYARSLGEINNETEFQKIIDVIKNTLGKEALEELHIHMSGISFGKKGELNHLPLEESKFNYKDVLKVLKKNKISGYVTCESPNLEEDALLMKKFYNSL